MSLKMRDRSHRDPVRTTNDYATLGRDELLRVLETGPAGLTEAEAARRLELFGANLLPSAKKRPWYLDLIGDLTHFFAILLWIGAALAWFAGIPELSVAIILVIIINGVFSFWQEFKAERAAEALRALLPNRVTVRRDAREQIINAIEVVRGDVLILTEGMTVPADARLIVSENLRLDLSSLTGESKPVPRSTIPPKKGTGTVIRFPNLVFAGTAVSSGRGEAIVFAVADQTEFGRIAGLTEEQKKDLSPLEIELQRVTRIVTVLALGLGVLFFTLGVLLGGLSLATAGVFAIGIIVANVPEGLLPTLTLSLAFGVRRMARRRALVKRLSAVETLGSTTIILTDKTGTLTENEMTVRELWTPDGSIEMDECRAGDGSRLFESLVRTAALCCDARVTGRDRERHWTAVGDPTETAIVIAAAKLGLDSSQLARFPKITELPFDSTRKRMTTIRRIDGTSVACVKGALNEMLRFCDRIERNGGLHEISDEDRSTIVRVHNELAGKGRRVLAVAHRNTGRIKRYNGELRPADVERSLTFQGLIAMEDPPRPEVASAIDACRRAGVRVAMVTGDDGLTATAIGREIGLHPTPPRVITGDELDQMDPVTLTKLFRESDVLFSRVSPEHKLRIVATCQRLGEIVAVTGDGVNDAPALKRADIGIAMGATGTDVAREAADMVLTDDNFASIVDAIREGRAVFGNIRKFVGYVFVSNAAEMLPFVVFVLFGVPLPLTILQVLAVDVGTDLLPALALGAEAPEDDVMNRPPRSRTEGVLNWPTLVRSYLWLGSIEAFLALFGYYFVQFEAGWRPGAEYFASGPVYLAATTVTFAGIVMSQIGNAFAWRSETRSVLSQGIFSNHLLIWCIAAEVALMFFLIYLEPVAAAIGMTPPDWRSWTVIVLFGPILLGLEEIRKAVSRGFQTSAGISTRFASRQRRSRS